MKIRSSLFHIYLLLNVGVIITFVLLLPYQAIGSECSYWKTDQTKELRDTQDIARFLAMTRTIISGTSLTDVKFDYRDLALAQVARVITVRSFEDLKDKEGNLKDLNDNLFKGLTGENRAHVVHDQIGGSIFRVLTHSEALQEKGFFRTFSQRALQLYTLYGGSGLKFNGREQLQPRELPTEISFERNGEELLRIELRQKGGVLFVLQEGFYNSVSNALDAINWRLIPDTSAENLLQFTADARLEEINFRRNRNNDNNQSFRYQRTTPEHLLLALVNDPNYRFSDVFSRLGEPSLMRRVGERTLGGFFNRYSAQARIRRSLYRHIREARPEDRKNENNDEDPSNITRVFTETRKIDQQETPSTRQIPFTERLTATEAAFYRLNQSDVNKTANALFDRNDSSNHVITGDVGSGRRTMLDQIADKLLDMAGGEAKRERVRVEVEKTEDNNENNNNRTRNPKIEVELLSFNSYRVLTEGETRFVGVIPKNIGSFIEAIRSQLDSDSNTRIILFIRDSSLNTLLNLGKTDSDSGTQLQNDLVNLMRDYSGRFKIIGYTEAREHNAFMESNLGRRNFQQLEKKTPTIEEVGYVIRFIVEKRVERSDNMSISSNEREMIIKGILHLYQAYSTYRYTYFEHLEKNINQLFQEIQARRENGDLTTISEGDLDIIISKEFLDNQPFRRYIGDPRFHDLEGAMRDIREAREVVGEADLAFLEWNLRDMMFSSNKNHVFPGDSSNRRPYSIRWWGGNPASGKSLITEVLAKWFSRNPNSPTPYRHIDGNNTKERSKIIGEHNPLRPNEDSPVNRASLTRFVTNNPNATIYVNEAHRLPQEIKELIESILENGQIEDAKGRIVSFEQTHWIFDSNPVNDPWSRNNNRGTEDNRVESREQYMEWMRNHNDESFISRFNDRRIQFKPQAERDGLIEQAAAMIERKGWIVEDNKVYEVIVDNNEGSRLIRNHIEMLNAERQHQLVRYADERGLLPTDLHTRLVVENNEVRIIVERESQARTEIENTENQQSNIENQQPPTPSENEPSRVRFNFFNRNG